MGPPALPLVPLTAAQMELVAVFPPSRVENLPVWQHVLLRALSPDACLRLRADVTALTQQALDHWREGGYRLGQVEKVVRMVDFYLFLFFYFF